MTVIPEEGELTRIAKELLAVAEHPYEVQAVSHPHRAFRVPEDLFDRFQAAQREDAEESVASDVPQQKRRGRPRKQQVTQEETSSSDEEVEAS